MEARRRDGRDPGCNECKQLDKRTILVKAVILAGIMSAIYTILLTLFFRFRRGNYLRARFMIQLFLLTLPLGIALYSIAPSDFAWIPQEWRESNQPVEIGFFLVSYSC